MKKLTSIIVALAVVVVSLSLVACGPSKAQKELQVKQQAKDAGIGLFQRLRVEPSGDRAADFRSQINSTLKTAGLTTTVIGATEAELDSYVKRAYENDAKTTLASLKSLHGDPDLAKQLRAEFFRVSRLSGEAHTHYGTDEQQLDRIVAQNFLAAAHKQGVRITASDYKEAGIPVPVIRVPAKPRPVPARRVPFRRFAKARR